MDEIAAARSMRWNVEFDRGLRSQKPGSQWEAILKLGLRLQQWSKEPPVSAVTANLFKLDPGQDQAFANAVVLHLVEAFKGGNNFTRLYVLKILLLEKRSRRRGDKRANCNGLLSKDRIPNHVEVLKRVKAVMDSGDTTARALTLRVLGCLADLAKDSADVHRLVFEALDSPCEQEVHAGLYAVGCLCEISEPFSTLALERLIDVINAMETTPKTRIRAIRIFAQMHLLASASFKAYETGKGLMLRIPTDEVVVTTLEALSRLAFKASIILADQVDLVLSYVCSDPRSNVRVVSVKCFIRLASKATGWVSSTDKVFEIMISILEDVNQPSHLQMLAVQALRKLLPHCIVAIDTCHFVRLFSVVELSAMHPDWSRVQPFLSLMVDLACNLEKLRPDVCKAADKQMGLERFLLLEKANSKVQTESDDNEPIIRLDISTRIALLICDQVALLSCSLNAEEIEQRNEKDLITKPCHYECSVFLRRRCRFLCGLLLQLFQGCSEAGFVIVDCLVGMVEAVLRRLEQTASRDQQHGTPGNVFFQGKMAKLVGDCELEYKLSAGRSFLLKMICLCLRGCVSIIDSKEDYRNRILRRLSDLISCCTVVNASHHVLANMLPLLLKIRVYFLSQKESQEIAAKVHYMAQSFLEERDFWAAYKVCVHAACHGIWIEIPSVMTHIVDRAQSEGCHFWLTALAAVCTAEASIQIECRKILHANVGPENSNMALENINRSETCLGIKGNLGDAIARALPSLHVAASSLAAAVNLHRTYEFQRWLLTLRIACLRSSGELLGLLGPACLDLKGFDIQAISSVTNTLRDDLCLKQTISSIYAVAKKSEALSLQFTKLAKELDILCVSFMGMDKESLSVISCMALGCSFLSFCTAFALSYPQAWAGELGSNSAQSQVGYIANDLYQRLEGFGGDEWPDLLLFSLQLGAVKVSPLIARGASCFSVPEKLLILVRWAVREVLQLQDDAKTMKPQCIWPVLAKGLHVLKDILEKWASLPWMLPKHFLCTRPRVGFEAFVGRMDNREMDDIVVTQGSIVPLSLCLQICNLNVNSRRRVKRLGCALLLKTAERHDFVDEEFYTGWRLGWHDDQTIGSESFLYLMEELLFNMKMGVSTSEASSPVVICDVDEKGQAFSSYLLNTANLQCGSYCISLQAVCVDNEGHHWMLPQLNNCRTLRIMSTSD